VSVSQPQLEKQKEEEPSDIWSEVGEVYELKRLMSNGSTTSTDKKSTEEPKASAPLKVQLDKLPEPKLEPKNEPKPEAPRKESTPRGGSLSDYFISTHRSTINTSDPQLTHLYLDHSRAEAKSSTAPAENVLFFQGIHQLTVLFFRNI